MFGRKWNEKGGGGLNGFDFCFVSREVREGATQSPNIYNTFFYGH